MKALGGGNVQGFQSSVLSVSLKGAGRHRWSAAIMFAGVTDDAPVVRANRVEQGARDRMGVYVGTLYHLPASGNMDWSIGVGTNSESLCYFAGPSLRLGDKDARGYISVGLVGAQVRRLDGVAEGAAWADPTQSVPTRSVWDTGVGVALSLGF